MNVAGEIVNEELDFKCYIAKSIKTGIDECHLIIFYFIILYITIFLGYLLGALFLNEIQYRYLLLTLQNDAPILRKNSEYVILTLKARAQLYRRQYDHVQPEMNSF